MAKPRAILKRTQSVSNIAKITKTMQMIATAKFKRAHDRAVAARPYTDRLGRLIGELSEAAGEFTHPLLEARELRALRQRLSARDLDVEIHVSGKRIAGMLRFHKVEVAAHHHQFDDRP